MDTFGSSPNHTRALVRDTLTTTGAGQNRASGTFNSPKVSLEGPKDSLSISSKDLSNIVETIKANNITDIQSIKDYITFKDTGRNFNVNNLSDHQLSKLLSAVRSNIAENLAEVIYNTKNNEKLTEISAKERIYIDNILSKVRNSQITNLSQAIDLVKSQSADNPNILSKISGSLLIVVHQNEQQVSSNILRKDSFTPSFSIDSSRFSNPFKSDFLTRSNQPRTVSESKDFLKDLMTTNNDARRQFTSPQGTTELSNLILSEYLRGKNPQLSPEELTKSNMKQAIVKDEIWYHERMAHTKVSFINDVAAKIAANKAKTILSCRIVGEVGGAVCSALGMASLAGTSPLLGVAGAFIMTLIATVAGFMIGKAAGEGLGKVLTNTSFNLATPEEYERYKKEVEDLERERERQKKSAQQTAEEDDNEDESYEEESYEEDDNERENNNGFFNTIDTRVSNALKSKILFRKK